MDRQIGSYFKVWIQGSMDRQIGLYFKIWFQGSLDHQIELDFLFVMAKFRLQIKINLFPETASVLNAKSGKSWAIS